MAPYPFPSASSVEQVIGDSETTFRANTEGAGSGCAPPRERHELLWDRKLSVSLADRVVGLMPADHLASKSPRQLIEQSPFTRCRKLQRALSKLKEPHFPRCVLALSITYLLTSADVSVRRVFPDHLITYLPLLALFSNFRFSFFLRFEAHKTF